MDYIDTLELLKRYSDNDLFILASELRKYFSGNRFSTCMIFNAKSGNCSENCKWCSQSIFHNAHVDIYDSVVENKILNQAKMASDKGVSMFFLVISGRKLSSKKIIQASQFYRKAKKQYPAFGYCASMGLLNKSEFS